MIFFDTIVEQNPSMSENLEKDADIKNSKNFENALVKIGEGKESSMTMQEKDTVEQLKFAGKF